MKQPPDGYGILTRYGKYFIVHGIFYSEELPHPDLRGMLCKITILLDEKGRALSCESWNEAVECAWKFYQK